MKTGPARPLEHADGGGVPGVRMVRGQEVLQPGETGGLRPTFPCAVMVPIHPGTTTRFRDTPRRFGQVQGPERMVGGLLWVPSVVTRVGIMVSGRGCFIGRAHDWIDPWEGIRNSSGEPLPNPGQCLNESLSFIIGSKNDPLAAMFEEGTDDDRFPSVSGRKAEHR